MPIPADPVLYQKVKNRVKKSFKSYPSAYASASIVKEYKRLGGKYKREGKSKGKKSGLGRWFAEKWINICEYPKIVSCGRPKGGYQNYKKEFPLCRPMYRITSKTPRTVQELSVEERKWRCQTKRKNPYKRVYAKYDNNAKKKNTRPRRK